MIRLLWMDRYPINKLSPEHFPSLLHEMADPPKELWVAGSLPSDEHVALAVVGSRKHTAYGKDVCEELIAGLAGYPISIISGLALGIDGIAHKAAMKAGLHTLAVPGSGLGENVLYPRAHVGLAREILASGGGLLSEFAPDFKATAWSFPQRNRIMAGLSKAVLIIEAAPRSGTLITSRLATEYNRDVLAVPGSIFSEQSQGPNMLIALGATPISSSADLLRALDITPPDHEDENIKDYSHLPDEERHIMELLSEPREREVVIESIGLSASVVNVLLMRMEIAGLIKDDGMLIRRV